MNALFTTSLDKKNSTWGLIISIGGWGEGYSRHQKTTSMPSVVL